MIYCNYEYILSDSCDLPHKYLDYFMICFVTFPLVHVCLYLLFNSGKMELVIGINYGLYHCLIFMAGAILLIVLFTLLMC